MPKRHCKVSEEYFKEFPSIKKGKSNDEICCEICNCYINISHKGKKDIVNHNETMKHKKNLRGQSGTSGLQNFVVKTKNEDKIIRAAEATLAYHTVEHHHSFNSMDCTSKINKKIFNDSEIGKKITCGRTKTEAIINGVLGPHSLKFINKQLDEIPYVGVSTDASNHNSIKMFPILIQYFDQHTGMEIKVVDLQSITGETAEMVSEMLISSLEKLKLTKKCIAFSGDNCNTNFGGMRRAGKNNIFFKLKSTFNEKLVGVGCPAHILNNTIHTCCDSLPFADLESIVFKLFNYFNIYTVRVASLREFCDFVGSSYQQLLYHSKTRWLSLFPAIERLLKMFDALKAYFLSENNPPYLLLSFFENKFSEAYLFFVHSLMTVFHSNIERMERHENSIIEVMDILNSVLNTIEERLKHSFLPLKVKDILKKLTEEGYENEVLVFKNNVFGFYEKAIEYLNNWIKPFDEFKVFNWLNLKDLDKLNWEADIIPSISYLLEKGVELQDSKLFDQFTALKNYVVINPDENNALPSHKKWVQYFSSCKSSEIYSELLKICQFLFALTAHNANVERVFSLIGAQWTKERNRLLLETIKNMIFTKFNYQYSCMEFYDFIMRPEQSQLLEEIHSKSKYL